MSVTRRSGRFAAVTAVISAVIVVGGSLAAHAAITTGTGPAASASQAAYPEPAPLVTLETVATGIQVTGGEIVLRVQELDGNPDVRFGIMLGVRDASGAVDDKILNHGFETDVAPGFHAVYGATTVAGIDTPGFGYYAGPAARITGVSPLGATIEASLAEVEVFGSAIVVFWFDRAVAGACRESADPGDVPGWKPDPSRCDVTDVAAFDASGAVLPTGDHSGPGHG